MSDLPSAKSRPRIIDVANDSIVAVNRDYSDTFNTGVIVYIHSDGIEENRNIVHAVLAASALTPPLNPTPKHAIARYGWAIATTLAEATEAIRPAMVSYGNCDGILQAP